MNNELRNELLDFIRNDSEIIDAIKAVFNNSNYSITDSDDNEAILRNRISELEEQLQIESESKKIAENGYKKVKDELQETHDKLANKEEEMRRALEAKAKEYQSLQLKYTQCKDKYDEIVEKYNEFILGYGNLELIYKKYISLGSGVIGKLERVLNKGIDPCDTAEMLLAYGIQESNIVALWDSIATNIDYYSNEDKTKTLIDIFEYFINLYKEVTFKSVTINRPNEGDVYDERIHTRTTSSNAVGKIQEIVLPGFSIGKNITKKALVIVK